MRKLFVTYTEVAEYMGVGLSEGASYVEFWQRCKDAVPGYLLRRTEHAHNLWFALFGTEWADDTGVALKEGSSVDTIYLRMLMGKLGRQPVHFSQASHMLKFLCEHTPEFREWYRLYLEKGAMPSMLKNVRTWVQHREDSN